MLLILTQFLQRVTVYIDAFWQDKLPVAVCVTANVKRPLAEDAPFSDEILYKFL